MGVADVQALVHKRLEVTYARGGEIDDKSQPYRTELLNGTDPGIS